MEKRWPPDIRKRDIILPFVPVIGQIVMAWKLFRRLREEFSRLWATRKSFPSRAEIQDLLRFWQERQAYFYRDPEVCAKIRRFSRAAAAIGCVFLGSATLGAVGGGVGQVLMMGAMGLLFVLLSIFLSGLTRDKGSDENE